MKKLKWKIELLKQIPLVLVTAGLVCNLEWIGKVIHNCAMTVSELFHGAAWAWTLGGWLGILALALPVIALSLLCLKSWKLWLFGLPMQLIGCVVLMLIRCGMDVSVAVSILSMSVELLVGALFCQAVALLIKSLIRRSKAKKAILESEVTEG